MTDSHKSYEAYFFNSQLSNGPMGETAPGLETTDGGGLSWTCPVTNLVLSLPLLEEAVKLTG